MAIQPGTPRQTGPGLPANAYIIICSSVATGDHEVSSETGRPSSSASHRDAGWHNTVSICDIAGEVG